MVGKTAGALAWTQSVAPNGISSHYIFNHYTQNKITAILSIFFNFEKLFFKCYFNFLQSFLILRMLFMLTYGFLLF